MSGVIDEEQQFSVDKWGGVLLLASCAAASLLLAQWSVCKWRAGRKTDKLAAGGLRLAAARGDLASLQLLALLPVSRAARAEVARAWLPQPPPPVTRPLPRSNAFVCPSEPAA